MKKPRGNGDDKPYVADPSREPPANNAPKQSQESHLKSMPNQKAQWGRQTAKKCQRPRRDRLVNSTPNRLASLMVVGAAVSR
jgi:hypothetical protein